MDFLSREKHTLIEKVNKAQIYLKTSQIRDSGLRLFLYSHFGKRGSVFFIMMLTFFWLNPL